MAAAAPGPRLYNSRRPERTVLFLALADQFERFLAVYEERFKRTHGFLYCGATMQIAVPPVVLGLAFLIDFASLRRILAHLGFAPQQPEPLVHAPPEEAETYAALARHGSFPLVSRPGTACSHAREDRRTHLAFDPGRQRFETTPVAGRPARSDCGSKSASRRRPS